MWFGALPVPAVIVDKLGTIPKAHRTPGPVVSGGGSGLTIRGLLRAGRWLSVIAILAMAATLGVASHMATTEGQRGDAVIALQARTDALSALADALALNGGTAAELAAFSAEARALRDMLPEFAGAAEVLGTAAQAVTELEALLLAMAGPDGTIAEPASLDRAYRLGLAALADAGLRLDAAVLDLLFSSKASIVDRFWSAAVVIVAMGLSAFAAVIALLRWLEVSLVKPIGRMTTTVDRMRDGDRSSRAVDTGLRELALLGRHINDMAEGRTRVEDGLRAALKREENLNATLCRTKTIGQMGGWYADFRADTLTWDWQTCAIFGISPDDAPTRPAGFFARVDPRDRDRVANVQVQQVEAGERVDIQHRILTPAGVRWVWERAEILCDDSGTPVALDGTIQDITHLKETELELEAAREAASRREALLRIAGRTARFGGWRYSVPEDRLDWTPETAMIYDLPTGIRPTVRRLIAKCDPADRDRLRQCLTASVTEGRNFNDVFRQTTARGRPIWTRITGDVVRDADGTIVAVHGACQDVSDLIAARSEADRRNAELEGVVLSMQDGFIMLDENGTVQFLNKRARAILRLGRGLREGANLFRKLDRADDNSMLAQLRDSLRRCENTLVTLTDRETGIAVETAIQIVDTRRIILARDVTKERLAQRRLLLLDAALEEIEDIVLITEVVQAGNRQVLHMLYANSALQRITGLDPKTLIGQSPLSRFPREGEDQIAALDRLVQAAGNREAVAVELCTQSAAGASLWFQVQNVPLSDPDSGRDYIVSIERDITEEKAREERAFHTAKMEAIGQLTGGVAHDFNNLLTVILGNADMLHDTIDDDDARRRVEAMISAAERGARLTDSMLAFSRRTPLRPTHTDVNQLIDQSLSLLRKAVPEDIEIDMALDADQAIADVDSARLQAAIVNLVLNSRDAIDGHGHVTLATSNLDVTEADRATLPVARVGTHLVVTVSDDGRGIAPDVLSRVFEPFFTTKPVGAGTGLGLSTVYGFANQSGGHVAIASEPGLGTTVRLYLPCVRGGGLVDRADLADAAVPMGQGEPILVVEDDPALLDFVMRQMALLNYDATPAQDAETALALLTAQDLEFRLLFTDVVLPGEMHGGELAERARSLRPDLKVLFTSGYTRSALDRQGRIDADVNLLGKPYRLADLAKSLRDAMSG